MVVVGAGENGVGEMGRLELTKPEAKKSSSIYEYEKLEMYRSHFHSPKEKKYNEAKAQVIPSIFC